MLRVFFGKRNLSCLLVLERSTCRPMLVSFTTMHIRLTKQLLCTYISWKVNLYAKAGTAIARLSHRNSVRPSVCLSHG